MGLNILVLISLIPIVFASSESYWMVNSFAVEEFFSIRIEPKLFNWTFQELTDQYKYRVSLEGYPDLPGWMRYMYSTEHHAGYVYGTPPKEQANKQMNLEVICLNTANYETKILTYSIKWRYHNPVINKIQMKIDNLNWVHIMDPGRLANLKTIFTHELWPESVKDFFLVFMDSAVTLGGRVPLTPQQTEGVIVEVGSSAQFSKRLQELQDEVRPLYKIQSCSYKRTTVEKIFENAGFKIDWCAFRLIPHEDEQNQSEKENNQINTIKEKETPWSSIRKSDVPQRNYGKDLAFSVVISATLFTLCALILTVLFCCQHPKLYRSSEPIVQMVQYSNAANQPVTVLRSLRDPDTILDNVSIPSQSPNTNGHREDVGVTSGNSYMRPRPPPYHRNRTIT